MAAKKNLKNKLDQHNKEIKSSSELNDRLAADIPETGQEAQEIVGVAAVGEGGARAEAADGDQPILPVGDGGGKVGRPGEERRRFSHRLSPGVGPFLSGLSAEKLNGR